jgi:hypothetical protein
VTESLKEVLVDNDIAKNTFQVVSILSNFRDSLILTLIVTVENKDRRGSDTDPDCEGIARPSKILARHGLQEDCLRFHSSLMGVQNAKTMIF